MRDNEREVKGYLQRKKEIEGQPQGKETHPGRKKLTLLVLFSSDKQEWTHNPARAQNREIAHVVNACILILGFLFFFSLRHFFPQEICYSESVLSLIFQYE